VEQILEPGMRVTVAMGTNRDLNPGWEFVSFSDWRILKDFALKFVSKDGMNFLFEFFEGKRKVIFVYIENRVSKR
jgi:hypothetical protein